MEQPATLSSLDGGRALVVGARRGIGLAFAHTLARSARLAELYVSARHHHASNELETLAARTECRIHPIAMDVTDEDSVRSAANSVQAETETLDLIVNCAGLLHDGDVLTPEKKLEEVQPNNLETLFRVHATGPLLIAKHFQPLLPRDRRFVFASLSARVGSIGDNRLGGWYGYRVTKAAHNMAIKTLSIELARRSRQAICVALHPGTVDTDLSRPFSQRVPAEKLFTPERAARQLLQVIDALEPGDNGTFLAWDGSKIPW